MAQVTQKGHFEPVSLPNHTFPGQALLKAVNQYLYIFFCKKLTTACFLDQRRGETQLAFFINLQRAVIGPSATLTGR